MSTMGSPPSTTDAEASEQPASERSDFDVGFLLGVLVGEGHFGGDGRFPQITLRMHTRHEKLFRWLVLKFGGRLYGPYHHGGRSYFQWMVRGTALRREIVPLLAKHWPYLDDHVRARIESMCERYSIELFTTNEATPSESAPPAP